eukprot:TRINITY_DN23424_c0_g1_i1.p1 TRINITY_DN23424_c0_g1~~TRINITY_DN23424_c0_g1_i1.p1  ORF type:complete len:655 (+),score=179.60 TRINITY_DN23424_c0_g1_i1:50-1966(+)
MEALRSVSDSPALLALHVSSELRRVGSVRTQAARTDLPASSEGTPRTAQLRTEHASLGSWASSEKVLGKGSSTVGTDRESVHLRVSKQAADRMAAGERCARILRVQRIGRGAVTRAAAGRARQRMQRLHSAARVVQAAARRRLALWAEACTAPALTIQRVWRGFQGRLRAAAWREEISLPVWAMELLWSQSLPTIGEIAAEENGRWESLLLAFRQRVVVLLERALQTARSRTMKDMLVPGRRLVPRWAVASEPPWRVCLERAEQSEREVVEVSERSSARFARVDSRVSTDARRVLGAIEADEGSERSGLVVQSHVEYLYTPLRTSLLHAQVAHRQLLDDAERVRRLLLVDASESLLVRAAVASGEDWERSRLLRDSDTVLLMLAFAASRFGYLCASTRDKLIGLASRASGEEELARPWVERAEADARAALIANLDLTLQADLDRLTVIDDGRRLRGGPRWDGAVKDVVYAVVGQNTRHVRSLPLAGSEPSPAQLSQGGRCCALHLDSLDQHTGSTAASLLAEFAGVDTAARIELLHGWRKLKPHESLAGAGVRHGGIVFAELVPPPPSSPKLRPVTHAQRRRARPSSAGAFTSLRDVSFYADLPPAERQAFVGGAAGRALLRHLRSSKQQEWEATLSP